MEKRAALIFLLAFTMNLAGQETGFPVSDYPYFPMGIENPSFSALPAAPFEQKTVGSLRFYPPLDGRKNRGLSLIVPANLEDPLLFLTDQGILPVDFSGLPEGSSIYIRIPDNLTLQGLSSSDSILSSGSFVDMTRQDPPETGLFMDLADPETLIYRIPPRLRQGEVILTLTVRVSGNLTITGPEETPLRLQPRETKQSVSLFSRAGKTEWNLSPLEAIRDLTFLMEETPGFPAPLPGNLSDILNTPAANWRNRDFELYRWNDFPGILIWDCLDYDIQNRFFRRLSYFVEKKGFRGSLMTSRELQGLHGWNAHDYRPEDLADFFNLAESQDFPLYDEEWLMRDILVSRGVLIRNPQGILSPGEGAVISISRESSSMLRERFLIHEASHGLYFTSSDYRDFSARMWKGLSDEDRKMWRFFLGWYGYDPSDEDLMINEFQAYLVQQKSEAAPEYFDNKLSNLIGLYPGQRSLLENGTGENREKFSLWSGLFGRWLMEKWGIDAGDFFRLYKDL